MEVNELFKLLDDLVPVMECNIEVKLLERYTNHGDYLKWVDGAVAVKNETPFFMSELKLHLKQYFQAEGVEGIEFGNK